MWDLQETSQRNPNESLLILILFEASVLYEVRPYNNVIVLIQLTNMCHNRVAGKSLIGGRKALENRRFIKQLISEQESTGLKRDLNTAISRIMGEKKRLADKNKGRRNVIKQQTQETKNSLAESILRAKVDNKF